MGADRRGPLAAFIILAIIAIILLVTSVRSQAAVGWLRTTLTAGPVSEPHLADVPGKVTRVVHHGIVLVRKAADDTSGHQAAHQARRAASGVSTSVVSKESDRTTARVDVTTKPPAAAATRTGETPTSHLPADHGRHLGWDHGRGHRANAHRDGQAWGHIHGRGWLSVGWRGHGGGH